jgi:hypothetical protein
MDPEVLDGPGSEKRRRVYSVLKLTVEALADGGLKVSGVFGEENLVCHHEGTSTR